MSKGIRPLPLPGKPTLNDILLSFTKLLTYLKPGERQTIELDAPIGSFYRISDLLNNTVCVVNLGPVLDEHIQQVQVALIDHQLRIAEKEVLPVKLETPTAHFNYQQCCTLPGGMIVYEAHGRALTPYKARLSKGPEAPRERRLRHLAIAQFY
jgi:hypothetical protein